MSIVLSDDGTLDTVLVCTECRAHFRYNFASHMEGADEAEPANDDAYDQFVAWAIADAAEEHECMLTEEG